MQIFNASCLQPGSSCQGNREVVCSPLVSLPIRPETGLAPRARAFEPKYGSTEVCCLPQCDACAWRGLQLAIRNTQPLRCGARVDVCLRHMALHLRQHAAPVALKT